MSDQTENNAESCSSCGAPTANTPPPQGDQNIPSQQPGMPFALMPNETLIATLNLQKAKIPASPAIARLTSQRLVLSECPIWLTVWVVGLLLMLFVSTLLGVIVLLGGFFLFYYLKYSKITVSLTKSDIASIDQEKAALGRKKIVITTKSGQTYKYVPIWFSNKSVDAILAWWQQDPSQLSSSVNETFNDNNSEEKNKSKIYKICGAVPAVAAVILFFISFSGDVIEDNAKPLIEEIFREQVGIEVKCTSIENLEEEGPNQYRGVALVKPKSVVEEVFTLNPQSMDGESLMGAIGLLEESAAIVSKVESDLFNAVADFDDRAYAKAMFAQSSPPPPIHKYIKIKDSVVPVRIRIEVVGDMIEVRILDI